MLNNEQWIMCSTIRHYCFKTFWILILRLWINRGFTIINTNIYVRTLTGTMIQVEKKQNSAITYYMVTKDYMATTCI